MIQTAFENSGYQTFTTPAQETAFLQAVAQETKAQYSVAGHSVEGRPINRLDLGNPIKGTHLVTTGQHGNEMAPREGVLSWIRDLAFTRDYQTRKYLAEHRIVVLSVVNPDNSGIHRLNANEVDLNRDGLALSQPESRAVASVIREVHPHLISDHHGRDDIDSGVLRWEGTPSKTAVEHPAFTHMAPSLMGSIGQALAPDGWREFRPQDNALLMMSNIASYHHAFGFLSECWSGTYQRRWETSKLILNTLTAWHQANAERLETARNLSIMSTIQGARAYPIETGLTQATKHITWIDPPPARYDLNSTIPEELVDGFGIQVTGDTVDMSQPAGQVIPMLMDPQAPLTRVEATRVDGPSDPVGKGAFFDLFNGHIKGMKYKYHGSLYPAAPSSIHIHGKTANVTNTRGRRTQ